MLPRALKLFAWIIAGVFVACGGDETAPVAPPSAPGPVLLAESLLTSGCLDWPETEFTPERHAVLETYGPVGERAIDFTLKDVAGVTHSLSSLLETRPVLLVLGSFT